MTGGSTAWTWQRWERELETDADADNPSWQPITLAHLQQIIPGSMGHQSCELAKDESISGERQQGPPRKRQCFWSYPTSQVV